MDCDGRSGAARLRNALLRASGRPGVLAVQPSFETPAAPAPQDEVQKGWAGNGSVHFFLWKSGAIALRSMRSHMLVLVNDLMKSIQDTACRVGKAKRPHADARHRQTWARRCAPLPTLRAFEALSDLILRSRRSRRLEGCCAAPTRRHPSRRAQERAPQDEATESFHGLVGWAKARSSRRAHAATAFRQTWARRCAPLLALRAAPR